MSSHGMLVVGLLAGVMAAAQGVPAVSPAVGAVALLDLHSRAEYQKLESGIEAAHGAKQAEMLGRLAQFDYSAAHAGVDAGNFEAAEASLTLARQRADRAMDLLQEESRHGKTDGMQTVEMSLQTIAYGLRDMAHDLPLRVRPFVDQTQNHFADLRGRLLDLMFAGKHPPPGGGPR